MLAWWRGESRVVLRDLLGQFVTMVVRVGSRAYNLRLVSCFMQKRQTKAVLVSPLAESRLRLSQSAHLARVKEQRAQGNPVARTRSIMAEGPGNDVALVTIWIGVPAGLRAHVDEIVLAAPYGVGNLTALAWVQKVGSHTAIDGRDGSSTGPIC
jgi:hypothetical protein